MVYSFIAGFDIWGTAVCKQTNAYPHQFKRILFFFGHFPTRINTLAIQGTPLPATIN